MNSKEMGEKMMCGGFISLFLLPPPHTHTLTERNISLFPFSNQVVFLPYYLQNPDSLDTLAC